MIYSFLSSTSSSSKNGASEKVIPLTAQWKTIQHRCFFFFEYDKTHGTTYKRSQGNLTINVQDIKSFP